MTSEQREKCSCFHVSEHVGPDADRYAAEHLEKVEVDSINWTVEYRCPLYGKKWLQDMPYGMQHGGGPYRLRTFEKVCRDLRRELATVPTILADHQDAAGAARVLLERLGDCSGF
jgi:hypothetical protein